MNESRILVGNAPVSWGIYGAQDAHLPWPEVMDAIARAGYQGTELGPYGYYPKEPGALDDALKTRGLRLGSSYVGLPLEDPSRREEAVAACLEVARLLATQGVRALIVADDDHPERAACAGRVPADGSRGWSEAQWKEAAKTLDAIGRRLREELDLGVVVHHHVGTFIETPEEVSRLLALTDPRWVNLLLDTGHAVYGGGDPLEWVARFPERIGYVHLKDVRAEELARVRREPIPMKEAWRRGIFCPLGEGVVDFPALVEALRRAAYSGWAIVEQDVVPDDSGTLRPDPFECARQSRRFLRERVGL